MPTSALFVSSISSQRKRPLGMRSKCAKYPRSCRNVRKTRMPCLAPNSMPPLKVRYYNSMYLNKVFLYGNLTRDPELKALPSGQQLASFGLATNRTYKDKNGQKQEATEFHNIVALGRPAGVIAQYMKKGRPMF